MCHILRSASCDRSGPLLTLSSIAVHHLPFACSLPFCTVLRAPQEDKISALVKAANVDVEAFWPSLFAKLLQKVSVDDIVKGMSAAPVAGAAPAAGGAAPADADAAEEVRLLVGTQGMRAMRVVRMRALLFADDDSSCVDGDHGCVDCGCRCVDGDSGCVDDHWRGASPRRSSMLTHIWVPCLCLLCCPCSCTVATLVIEEGGGAGGGRGG